MNLNRNIKNGSSNGMPLEHITLNQQIEMYDSAVRKVLYSTKDMLEELSWTHHPRNQNQSKERSSKSRHKSRTEKHISTNTTSRYTV